MPRTKGKKGSQPKSKGYLVETPKDLSRAERLQWLQDYHFVVKSEKTEERMINGIFKRVKIILYEDILMRKRDLELFNDLNWSACVKQASPNTVKSTEKSTEIPDEKLLLVLWNPWEVILEEQ